MFSLIDTTLTLCVTFILRPISLYSSEFTYFYFNKLRPKGIVKLHIPCPFKELRVKLRVIMFIKFILSLCLWSQYNYKYLRYIFPPSLTSSEKKSVTSTSILDYIQVDYLFKD